MKTLTKKSNQWSTNACLALLTSVVAMPVLAAPAYTFQSVTSQEDPAFTQLLGVNNDGVIAGYDGDGTNIPNRGFTYAPLGIFTPENVTGALQTQVIGISNTKVNHSYKTVGFYVDANMKTHGFGQTIKGDILTVDAPHSAFNQLLGVNDLNEAAGYSSIDPNGGTNQRAFIRNAAGFTYVPFKTTPINSQATSINDADIVSGFYQTTTKTFGFLWDIKNQSMKTLQYPNAKFTQALGINNAGQVVGVYSLNGDTTTHGFVYKQGKYTSIDETNGIGTTLINGINDRGQVVGFYTDNNDGKVKGFIGTPTIPLW